MTKHAAIVVASSVGGAPVVAPGCATPMMKFWDWYLVGSCRTDARPREGFGIQR